MPEQIRCPSCDAALRVPDDLLGKNVKCPKCQTTFSAEMEQPPEPEGFVRESAPTRRSRTPEEFEEEEFLEEEEEERPRRRKWRFTEAESLVYSPATALLVVGMIDILLGGMCVLVSVLGVSLLVMGGPGRRGVVGPDDIEATWVVYGIIGIKDITMGSLITIGAARMKKLASYGFAMTACILAMIPCANNCCLLGLPFGIWALVVLNKPEVKDAFSS